MAIGLLFRQHSSQYACSRFWGSQRAKDRGLLKNGEQIWRGSEGRRDATRLPGFSSVQISSLFAVRVN